MGAGSVTARYLHGDGIDDPIARYREGQGLAWFLTDHLGSVRAIADSTGAVVSEIAYDSFGNIVLETGAVWGDRIKFTGREWDSVAGLYYYRSRMYDPANGRFMSSDQIGFAAGDTNLYRYVGKHARQVCRPKWQHGGGSWDLQGFQVRNRSRRCIDWRGFRIRMWIS